MRKYPKLLSPIKVNSLILKNRIIAAPMGGGFIDKHKIEMLSQMAKGGAGLIIIGSCSIDNDRSMIAPDWGGLYEPYMEKFMDQLNVIHQYGAKASVELLHCGLWADVAHTGKNPIGPVSMIRNIGKDADGVQVDAMSEEDMEIVSENYANTAVRAKRFGFDMVMLHFAHGWLPAQFLSPKFNKRTDKYGGSFENRIRFPMMIVEKVRKAVGPDYPIDMRISGDERCEDGINPDEVIRFVQLIEDKIDMIHVSSGIDKYLDLTTYVEPPQLYPHCINVDLAEKMKAAVSIPVTTVGGITTPDEAEKILEEGKADFIAMARQLLADPEWPNKVKEGKCEDIVPCLRCLECYHVATEGFTHGCSVNTSFTRGKLLKFDLLEKKPRKKIVVVGGGPAGMKAALTAVNYGHEVILFEKESELGGLTRFADYEGRKIDLKYYRNHIINQIRKSYIDLRLSTEANYGIVKELCPDSVIVAVGSVPKKPRIDGVNLPNVIQALDVYGNQSKVGNNVVIIGGGEVGAELGLSLSELGKKVMILEMNDELAALGNRLYRAALYILMKKQRNLSWKTSITCNKITENSVAGSDKNGKEYVFEADTVILATGMDPLREVAESFIGTAENVKIIGDCKRPSKVANATYEGFFSITSL